MTIPLPRTLLPSGTSDVARVSSALRSTSELTLAGGAFLFLSSANIGSANTRLRFQRGAAINTATGATTTVDGDIDAGPWQIFTGTGAVRFGPSGPRIVHASWFGTGGAAIQAAHDALYDKGTVHAQEGGASVATSLAFSKPIRLDITRGGLTATSGCQHVIVATADLHVTGIHRARSTITPLAGYAAIKLADTWQGQGVGYAAVRLERVGCNAGTCLLDAWTVTTFNEGDIVIEDCLAENTTDYAVKLGASVYYGHVNRCFFTEVFGGLRIKDNDETQIDGTQVYTSRPVKFAGAASISSSSNPTHLTIAGLPAYYDNATVTVAGAGAGGRDLVATILSYSTGVAVLDRPALTTVSSVDAYVEGFRVLLEGPHHTDMRKGSLVGWSSRNADVRVMAGAFDGVGGIVNISETKFATERKFAPGLAPPSVEVYNPAAASNSVVGLHVQHSRFYAPDAAEAPITLIGKASSVATATIHTANSPDGHGFQVGDRIHVVFSDPRFNAQFLTITAVGAKGTSQTLSWATTAGTITPAALGGFVVAADVAAIRLGSPANGLLITHNDFTSHGASIDATGMAGATTTRGEGGRGVYRDNSEVGADGCPTQAFANHEAHGFSIVEPGINCLAPPTTVYGVPRRIESPRLQNRVLHTSGADAVANWNVVGCTLTAVADSFGTTTAVKISRSGTNPIMSTGPGPSSTFAEYTLIQLDSTALTGRGVLKFGAKGNTFFSLWTAIRDQITGYLVPNSQRTIPLPQDGSWCDVRIPFTVSTPGAANLQLLIVPGTIGMVDVTMGDATVERVQVSDEDCDWVPTTGAAISDTTTGLALLRSAKVGGYVTMRGDIAHGSAPSVANAGASSIGTGGTFALEATSNDMDGTIVVTAGSGAGNVIDCNLTFSATLPSLPDVQLTLCAGTAVWGAGNARQLCTPIITSRSTSAVRIAVAQQYSAAGVVTDLNFVNGSTYLIHYRVTLKS
jgi:hypothetical protein